MANEIPSPNKIIAALTAFPPKLSEVQSVFNLPEDMFESMVRSMGIEVPPGPNKMAVSMMSGFEEMLSGLAPASFPFPAPFAKSAKRELATEIKLTVPNELTAPRTEVEIVPKRFELR